MELLRDQGNCCETKAEPPVIGTYREEDNHCAFIDAQTAFKFPRHSYFAAVRKAVLRYDRYASWLDKPELCSLKIQ
jgi:hypothetical protein